MYVILLSVLAVAMKPGSKVNTPCSLIRFEMSSASGPMVPVMAFIRLVFPVARFLSSYFVLMRYSDGDGFGAFRPAALHGRTSESRERIPSARLHARSQARADLFEIRAAEALLRGKLAGLGFRRCRILLAELIDATAGIHNFLLAGIERMAVGANLDLQILADGRASLEMVAAGTSDRDDFVFWMDAGFHGNLDVSVAAESTSTEVRGATPKSPGV